MIYDGTDKLNRGERGVYENKSSFQYLKYGEVVSVTDDTGMGRIKVRIKGSQTSGGDDGILDSDLPFAIPMIQKHLQANPKIGETVWVFIFDNTKQHIDRLFIGPIISQQDKLGFDNGRTTALAGFSFGPVAPKLNLNYIPELKGIFPDYEDISIQGRFNTDITQKNNEIILRAGKFEFCPKTKQNPYNFRFNSKTQGFIQIKNEASISPVDSEENDTGSVINIVSNKINLITHKEGSPRFNVTNNNNLISSEELSRILTEAHPVIFGDVLLEYLELLEDLVINHVHNGNGNPPTDLAGSGNLTSVATFKGKSDDLKSSMLSKNIRIN